MTPDHGVSARTCLVAQNPEKCRRKPLYAETRKYDLQPGTPTRYTPSPPQPFYTDEIGKREKKKQRKLINALVVVVCLRNHRGRRDIRGCLDVVLVANKGLRVELE